MTEIPAGIRNCLRLPQAVNIPKKLDEKSPLSELVSAGTEITKVLEECGRVGRERNHNAHCPPYCDIKRTVPPLSELLRKAKD